MTMNLSTQKNQILFLVPLKSFSHSKTAACRFLFYYVLVQFDNKAFSSKYIILPYIAITSSKLCAATPFSAPADYDSFLRCSAPPVSADL